MFMYVKRKFFKYLRKSFYIDGIIILIFFFKKDIDIKKLFLCFCIKLLKMLDFKICFC